MFKQIDSKHGLATSSQPSNSKSLFADCSEGKSCVSGLNKKSLFRSNFARYKLFIIEMAWTWSFLSFVIQYRVWWQSVRFDDRTECESTRNAQNNKEKLWQNCIDSMSFRLECIYFIHFPFFHSPQKNLGNSISWNESILTSNMNRCLSTYIRKIWSPKI